MMYTIALHEDHEHRLSRAHEVLNVAATQFIAALRLQLERNGYNWDDIMESVNDHYERHVIRGSR